MLPFLRMAWNRAIPSIFGLPRLVSPACAGMILYEVSYVKKNAFPDSRVPKDGERVLSGNDVPSEITIREMLSGIKDAVSPACAGMISSLSITGSRF